MTEADDTVLRCGWGQLTCNCLQKFLRIEAFLVAACCLAFIQGMVVSGFVSVVLSTVERRFDLSSTQSAVIAMGFDVASIICLIPVSYFGGLYHKPRWVAAGALVMGLGSLMFAIPHFAAGHYTFTTEEENTALCGTNMTSSCHHQLMDNSTGLDMRSSNTKYILIMFIANMLHGMGASPIFTLVVAFIDENTPKKNASIYIAIYYSMALVGPAFGYIVGGEMLKYFVDVTKETSLTSNDHRWVGAWWIGFLVSGVLSLLVSIPMYAFPRKLPDQEHIKEEKKQEMLRIMGRFEAEESLKSRDILRSLKVLLVNPVFAFINISCAAEGALISGFVTFSPKFVEANFNLSPSWAAQLIGMATIPSGGLGMVFGGYMVKRYKLGGLSSLRVSLFFVAATLCSSLVLLIRCTDARYAGINFPYAVDTNISTDADLSLESPCNTNCSCSRFIVDPVCATDGTTYMSPCHAGCETFQFSDDGRLKYYRNCSCISTLHSWENPSSDLVVQGKCNDGCNLLSIFMPAYSIIISLTFVICTPVLTATLRCVPENQKSLALGWQWLTARILGMIPAPIIFGFIIDKACLFWHSKECNRLNGSCLIYTTNKMGVYFLCIVLAFKTVSFICLFFSYNLYIKKIRISNMNSIRSR